MSSAEGRRQAGVLNWINSFIQENPALVKSVTVFVGVVGTAVTALTAYAAISKVIAALNMAALFTGPAGVVLGLVAGVGALTAAMVGLKEAARNSLDESWELTAASREQYEQLQELNAEYARTVDQYGEASYEAQALRWRIEDLTAEYENGRQTLAEYTAAHESLMDSYRDMAASHAGTAAGLDTESASVTALIQKLGELSATSGSAAQNQEAILAIIDRLNDAVPDLALSYDSVASGSGAFIDSLYDMARAQSEARQMAADYEEYVDRVGQQGGLKAAQEDAAAQARLAQEDYEVALEAYNNAISRHQNDTFGLSIYFGARDESAALDEAKAQLDRGAE